MKQQLMEPANGNRVVLSETESEMLKHTINIRVLEDFCLSNRNIYQVPHYLREVNKEAYTPRLISIGPIHLDKQELNPMKEYKTRYFHFFWKRVSNELSMKRYQHYLETEEQEIRKCYAEKFPHMSKEMFVETVLMDAVFIMELLLRNSSMKSDTSKHSDDYILTQAWLSKNIARDLILLENQIPFFVLKELYDTVVPEDNKKDDRATPEDNKKNERATKTFRDLALEFFEFYDPQRSSSDETKKYSCLSSSLGDCQYFKKKAPNSDKFVSDRDRPKDPKHFTDLIRSVYIPGDLDENGCNFMWCMCNKVRGCERRSATGCPVYKVPRTATKLQESGVSFEKEVVNRRLLDITFEKKQFLSFIFCFGCLPCFYYFKVRFRIPQLKVDHTTECVLRNLIALEQCHYPQKPYICNYVSLVDSLIHTQVDVELLVEREVIVHELGSHKEVAALVNGLCKHVEVNSTCYDKLIDELDNHYLNSWNHTMAALKLVYFRDPWRASSTVVGIAVLIFTAFNFARIVQLLS